MDTCKQTANSNKQLHQKNHLEIKTLVRLSLPMLLLLGLTTVFSGCSQSKSERVTALPDPPTAQTAATENNQNAPAATKLVVQPGSLQGAALEINGQKISASDFKKRLFKARFVQAAQGKDFNGPAADSAYGQLKEHVLEEIVRETVIAQEATKLGVNIPDAQVEQVLADIKSRFPSEAAFKETMKSRGLDENTIKTYNKLQLLNDALIQKLGGPQQFDTYINGKIAASNINSDEKVINKLVFEIIQNANPANSL